jgi:FtsH-binding integral membrane protein
VAHPLLRWTSLVLFFGYAATLALAGAWGVVAARADIPLVLGLDLADVPDDPETNLLVQYRFLRAVEFGVGFFALVYWRRIFERRAVNRVFLTVMGAGVGARLLSLVVDGTPSAAMISFLVWELVGLVVILVYTRATAVA